MTYQEDLTREVPMLINDITGLNVPEKYSTLLTVFVLMLTYHGISVIFEKCFGKKSKAIDDCRDKMSVNIGTVYNFSKDKCEEVINKKLSKNKSLLKHIYIVRESPLQCFFCDLITFSMMLTTFYLNYKFIDGNNFVDCLLLLAIVSKGCMNLKEYKNVPEEKVKRIEEILEEV